MPARRSEGALEANHTTSPLPEYVPLIAKGAAIIFVGTITSGGLRYIFQVVVARRLDAELYGLFSLGLAVFNVVGAIAALGMSQGMLRFVSLHHGEGDRERLKGTIYLAAGFALAGSMVLSLVLMALAESLALHVFHAEGLANVLRGLAVAVPFFSLTTVLLASTQALRIMEYKVLVRDLAEPLLRIALVLVLFLLGWRLGGAVFAFVASIIASSLLSFFFYRRVFAPIIGSAIKPLFEGRRLLAFCWPLMFSAVFNLMEARISTFVLGYQATPGEVGVFSAAYRTSMLMQGILVSFNTMFSPIISDLYHRGELGVLERLFKVVAKWMLSLSLPAILLMTVFSREFMTVFGQGFAGGAPTLVVLSIGQVLNMTTGPLGVMIDMSGRSKLTLVNAVWHFVLQFGLCSFLIPRYGAMGAALATTVSIGFLRIVQLLQVYFSLRMHPFRAEFAKPLIAGGVALLVLGLGKAIIQPAAHTTMFLILGSSMALILYGFVLYRLGFDEEDKILLQRVRVRLGF